MTRTAEEGDAGPAAERHEAPDGPRVASPDRPADWRLRLHRMAVLAVALDVVLVALLGGLRLRQWMWIHTDPPYASMRFDFDINNAHNWGTAVLRDATVMATADFRGGKGTDWRYFLPAYAGLYDEVARQHPDGEYGLDYTPTRLFIAALWVRHEHLLYPHVRTWQRQYAYSAPLLRLNSACELLAAIGAFLLVRHWVWRGTLPPRPLLRRGGEPPLSAESSPMPTRAWVLGLVVAILIWFCPAILFDAHVFPQWDVWLLPSFFWAAWLCSIEWWFTAGLLIPFGILMKGQLTMVTPIFILWPLLERKPTAAVRFGFGFAVAAVALLLPWLVNGSMSWYKVSFEYPTRHFRMLAIGASDNLAALLGFPPFLWRLDEPMFTLHVPLSHGQRVITIKAVLIAVYGVCLLLCAVGAASKSRRNDPAFLIALTAPWVVLFAVLPQMHERYLLWAAAVSATCAAMGVGWALMHVIVTAISTSMILRLLLQMHPWEPSRLTNVLASLHPGVAWAVLLCAGIYLYAAVAPHRRRREVAQN